MLRTYFVNLFFNSLPIIGIYPGCPVKDGAP